MRLLSNLSSIKAWLKGRQGQEWSGPTWLRSPKWTKRKQGLLLLLPDFACMQLNAITVQATVMSQSDQQICQVESAAYCPHDTGLPHPICVPLRLCMFKGHNSPVMWRIAGLAALKLQCLPTSVGQVLRN